MRNSAVFRDRSAPAHVRSRRFRRACVFGWPSAFIFSPRHSPNKFGSALGLAKMSFWVKPKVQKEEPEKSRGKFLNSPQESFCRFLWKKRRKTIRRAKNSGNRRRSRLKRYADKLAPALLDGASAAGSASRFFAMRSLWCASRQAVDFHAPLRFARNDSFYFVILSLECTFLRVAVSIMSS